MIKITKIIEKNKPKLGLMCKRHISCHAHNLFGQFLKYGFWEDLIF